MKAGLGQRLIYTDLICFSRGRRIGLRLFVVEWRVDVGENFVVH